MDPFGAIVNGLDLSQPANEGTVLLLREALAKHQLLLFRGQPVSPTDQLRLTRYFGDLDPGISRRPITHQVGGYPDLLYIRNAPGSPTMEYGTAWHSDGLAYARRPHGATVLHSIECPPGASGDTLFADQYRAYDAIPVMLRKSIDGLHWYLPSIDFSEVPPGRGLIQPIVRTHPMTGRQMVYCSPQATKIRGVTDGESAEILAVVHEAQTREDFIYRHSWQPGDVVVWENYSLLHNRADVVDFATQGLRAMHRSATTGRFEAAECEAAPDHA